MKRFTLVIKSCFLMILFIAAGLFFFAIGNRVSLAEPHIGTFDVKEISDGWTITLADGSVEHDVSLPYAAEGKYGDITILENTIPKDIRRGMHIAFRTRRQDVIIYINGVKRAEYGAAGFDDNHRSAASALVLVDMLDEDAGGDIRLEITSGNDTRIQINTLTYAYGNNVWFPYLERNIPIVVIGVLSVIIGILVVISYFILKLWLKHKGLRLSFTVPYLSATVITIGLWILSESQIRQLIFQSPSLTRIFSFLLMEVVAGFAAMYFNEVQGGYYKTGYLAMETIVLLQVLINSVLSFTYVADYYDTLIFSHLWSVIVMVWSAATIVADIITRRIADYAITGWGMLFAIVSALLELLNYYFPIFSSMGVFIGIGMIALLVATIIQLVADTLKKLEERRINTEKMTEVTFRTIASTIDAKDEYTGGHSERVGYYAGLLAEKVAEKEGLSKEDIERSSYIGKMHDIGKIGVPDKVLNKPGKLEPEEFDEMKRHTIIGSDIIEHMDNVEGLQDGVRHHHERYDGTGYPDGLNGEEISLFSRILCLADGYDAMTTDRVYRRRLSRERVIEEIENNKGTQFDPYLADIMLSMIRSGELEG